MGRKSTCNERAEELKGAMKVWSAGQNRTQAQSDFFPDHEAVLWETAGRLEIEPDQVSILCGFRSDT